MTNINSVQGKLEKVRKPRVHITYDVETEGASIEKELPFIAGVVGDFSGKPYEKLKPLKDRKFIQIDGDNFNEVMQKMTPGLQFKVDNTLKDDGSELAVDLKFNSMDDFQPAKVAEQVEPLKKLMDIRAQLNDLLSKADRSDELESLLEDALQQSESLQALAKDLGIDPAAIETDSEQPQKGE